MGADLERLGREVARLGDAELARREAPPVGARLAWLRGARARERSSERRGRRFAWALALASSTAAALAAFAYGRLEGREPLHFEVGSTGGEGRPGAWMSASSAGELPVAFSDGTTLRLEPDARARVASVTGRGAHVVVERGRVELDVVHRASTEWTVTLGPFDVHVTGTRFNASWDPVAEVLALGMREGSVRVSGPCLTQARTAKKGEWLRLSCHDASTSAAGAGAKPGEPRGASAGAPVDAEAPAADTEDGAGREAVAAQGEPARPDVENGASATSGGSAPATAGAAAPGAGAQGDAARGGAAAPGDAARASAQGGAAQAGGGAHVAQEAAPGDAARAGGGPRATAGATSGGAVAGGAPLATPTTPVVGLNGGPSLAPTEASRPGPRGPTTRWLDASAPAPGAALPPRGAEARPAAPEGPAAVSTGAPAAGLPPPPSVSWQALAMTGDYQGALAAVEREGFASVVASANVADLKRLGDLARLAKAPARARAAYNELRQRVPGSDIAAVAAFELGRIAFDDARAFGDARRWFAAYLSERPQGSLAQEALGRLFEAQERAGDHEGARAGARTYLARYPNGPHAALAGQLVGP